MRHGKREARARARRAKEDNESIGSAVMEVSKNQQAAIFDSLLDAPELTPGRKLDLATIVDEQGLVCKSPVFAELRPKIDTERRSNQEYAERAKAARKKKQWLRKRGDEYDRDVPPA